MKSIDIGGIKNKILTSDWIKVRQSDLNIFGEVTQDLDPLHIDPSVASKGPFGTTIAFGFYTLSLMTKFSHELIEWEKYGYALNYGFNTLRFLQPVKVNSNIRAHFKLVKTENKTSGTLLVFDIEIEIENEEKPALIAEWLGLLINE